MMNYQHTLDITGAFISLLSTYYFIRLDNKAWPITLLATCLNTILYWQSGIYADTALESFYFLSTSYGWYLWRRPMQQGTLGVRHLFGREYVLLSVFILSVCNLIAKILSNYTHSTIPILDAFTTSLSLAAQWLMCHKVIETWILWFFTDVIYAYLFFYKQLPFHGLLMLIYTSMAIAGYLTWIKQPIAR